MSRWLLVIVLAAACGSKTPPLQSHDLPNSKKGKTVNEPKCPDNPPVVCRQSDLECSLDEARACYVCQCQMSGTDPDAKHSTDPPLN